MKSLILLTVTVSLAIAERALCAPQIPPGGIVSAADNSSGALGIAPGSLFTIYGDGLADRIEAAALAPDLPDSLGGASVVIRAGSVEIAAPLLYASPSQINGLMPGSVTPGPAEMWVRTSSGESAHHSVPIVPARFTAFTTSGRAFGPALVQQHRSGQVRLNRMLEPARPGDALVIWGTGLGGRQRDDVTVSIGLVEVKPFYAGPAPGLPGVDQINVFLPSGVLSDCFVPFAVLAGGPVSVYTLSTNAFGVDCPMLFALGREGLAELDAGRTVRITAMTVQPPAAEAWVGIYDAAHLSQLATYDRQPYGAAVACSGRGYSYDRYNKPLVPPDPVELYGLERAPEPIEMSVTGPGGCGWTFTRSADGVYRAIAPPGCPPATYSIRNPATTSTAAGNVGFELPLPPFPEVSFEAATGRVAWNGNFSGRLTLTLSSWFTLPGSIFNGQTSVRELTCRLSGHSGEDRIDPSSVAYALGLPSGRSAEFRQWSGGLRGGSWDGPAEALLVRLVQSQAQPLR